MTLHESQIAEAAGAEVGQAFNVLHWAMIGKATGADFADRVVAAIKHLDAARDVLTRTSVNAAASS